jgi:predicted TPR repeat methyltransferase
LRTELGKTLREMGDLPASIRELELVRAEHPRYPAGRIHLGISYHAAGRHDDAAAQWKAVLEGDPDNRSAKMYLAMLEASPPAPAPAPPEPPK